MHRLPPIIIHEVLPFMPLAEQAGEQLTLRGDWRKLKEITGDGAGVKVGVCDTGIDKVHIEGDLKGVVDFKDFTNSRSGPYDRNGHGSHVTGHIGARTNGSGMIGVASSTIMYHSKVLGDDGGGSERGIVSGMQWQADQGVEIINLSLGGGFSSIIEGACRELSQQGILINAAMGNEGLRGDGHPGNSRYTFGITAVDFNKLIAPFSSRSAFAKYCAYGVKILSCGLNGQYMRISGTSMATPDFTGLCAWFLSFMKKHSLKLPRTMEEWEALLLPGVEDLGKVGHDNEYGIGFIDPWKVISTLTPITPPPEKRFAGMLLSETDAYIFDHTDRGQGSVDIKFGTDRFQGTVRKV